MVYSPAMATRKKSADLRKKSVDFVQWLESQLEALRAGRFAELDVETVVDEAHVHLA